MFVFPTLSSRGRAGGCGDGGGGGGRALSVGKLCYAYNSVGGLKLFCLKGFEKIVHRDLFRTHPFRSLFAQGGNHLIHEETILLVSRGVLITAQ